MSMKRPHTSRDRMASYLVVVVILGMIALGAFVLYMSGLFEPVQGEVMLSDTPPLDIVTAMPGEEGEATLISAEEILAAMDEVEDELGLAGLTAAEEAGEETDPTPAATEDVLLEGESLGPAARLLTFFFASASAEEAPTAETSAPGEAPVPDAQATDLDALLATLEEAEESESDITEADRVEVDKRDLAINQNLPEDWYNVLLLATDSRNLTANLGRTDVMIIASINAGTGEIKLSSLARDMYVPIPNTTFSNRINTAYAYGGAALAMKAVNQNFEMNIESYVLVNFSTMAAIVDSLGGLDIHLEENEYREINEIVAVAEDYEGFEKSASRQALTEADTDTVVHLDGLQSVAYARIRKIDSDLQRGSRQRIVLQAMLDKVMQNATLQTLVGLFNSMSRTTETNLAITKIIDISTMLLLADSVSITELSLPIAGSYQGAVEKDGAGKDINVLRVSLNQNVPALHEFIYGEYIPAAAGE